MAQLGARLNGIQEAAGSIPASSTKDSKKGFHPLFAFCSAKLNTPNKECASHGVNPMLRFSQRRGSAPS